MTYSEAKPGPCSRLVIVGGGTAGWMAAISLNRFVRALGGSVVLVESPAIGTIGVGEATIPPLVHWIRALQLDEEELMRKCSATFKLGIKFENWSAVGESYWHPFGVCGAMIDSLDLFHFWSKRRAEVGSALKYSDYSAHAAMAEAGKSPWPYGGKSFARDASAYAYHLDAAALAEYLKEVATREGVQHLFGEVKDVALDENGDIASLDIGGERTVEGDLFIDATGFAGVLIEKTLDDRWIDWSSQMLCDSAVTMPLQRDETYPPYTLSTAMDAGWCWTIPLRSRVGTGYVYSSAHITQEAATEALIKRSGLKKAKSADPRALKFRVGRRANFWRRNCISVGLASGFVEPLESTGIHLIQMAVKLLIDFFPDRQGSPALRRAYNGRMGAIYDAARDFILLHYMLSRREEPFWRASRGAPMTDSLRELLAIYDESGRIESSRLELFTATSYFFILTGNDRVPRHRILEAEIAPAARVWQLLDRIRADSGMIADRAQTHADYLAQLNRTPI